MKFVKAEGLQFLAEVGEDAALNQYWYTATTIRAMCDDLEAADIRVAFLSTPSVYFSLNENSVTRNKSVVFDYDKQWAQHPNYQFYDFNDPQTIPKEMHGTFDQCVVDPPFITHDVWRKYGASLSTILTRERRAVLPPLTPPPSSSSPPTFFPLPGTLKLSSCVYDRAAQSCAPQSQKMKTT
jgi:hypothetical protein